MEKKNHYTSTMFFAKFKKILPKQNLKMAENAVAMATEFFPRNLI